MRFCIFSYNRAAFLLNCVQSIERCVRGAKLSVIDDGSEDPATLEALREIGENHEVLRPQRAAGGKHGGLYANMQLALERFADEALVCFLQDDMQIVRDVDEAQRLAFADYFAHSPRAGFLHPCFLKSPGRPGSLRFEAGTGTYQRPQGPDSVGRFYSDIFLARPARLLEEGWRFAESEPENERQAGARFEPMGYLFMPFAMWLPEVPAWRGQRKTLALRLAERTRNCGFHPFTPLAGEDLARLRQRTPAVLPCAEDFLRTRDSLPGPWRYYPLQGRRILKRLNSLELLLRQRRPWS